MSIFTGSHLGTIGNMQNMQNTNSFTTAKSNSPIESAFSRTRSALEVMNERIADLEKRLHPVLSPTNHADMKEAACSAGTDMPPVAPMQENVDALTTAILRQAERLRDLLDYLQL